MSTRLFLKIFKNFISNNNAVVAPVIAGIAITALSISFVSVDVVHFSSIKSQLQSCADSATISAMSVTNSHTAPAYDAHAITHFNNCIAKISNASYVTIDSVSANRANRITPTGNVLVGSLEAMVTVKTYFSNKFGLSSSTIAVDSEVSKASNSIDLIVTLPQQGTMCGFSQVNSSGDIEITPDPACTKFTIAKNSIQRSIDSLETLTNFNIGSSAVYRMGVIPFTYTVHFPPSISVPTSMANLEPEGSAFFQPGSGATISEIVNFTPINSTSSAALKSHIAGLINPVEEDAWVRTDIATHAAAEMFKASAPNTDKYLILTSDGANLGCCYTNIDKNYASSHQYVYTYQPYFAHLINSCDYLKVIGGVKIFTIYIKPTDPGNVGNQNITDLDLVMSYCASYDQETTGGAWGTDCKNKKYCFEITEDKINTLETIYDQILAIIQRPQIDS